MRKVHEYKQTFAEVIQHTWVWFHSNRQYIRMATHPLHGMGPAEEADVKSLRRQGHPSWLVLMMETMCEGNFNCRW
jgi:hypothetical protein